MVLEKKRIAMTRGAGNDPESRVQKDVLFKPCLEGRQNSCF